MSAAQPPSAQGSPFWRFSLHFYRQPKVADTCIALQEEAGVDVNLLLFLLWQPALPDSRAPSREKKACRSYARRWKTTRVLVPGILSAARLFAGTRRRSRST